MISDPSLKIGRPRQLYTGSERRDYVPAGERLTYVNILSNWAISENRIVSEIRLIAVG